MNEHSRNEDCVSEIWSELGRRLLGLSNRTLYHVTEYCGTDPKRGETTASAVGYRCMPADSAQAALYTLLGTSSQPPDVDYSRVYPQIQYEWFSPDPVGMPEPELDDLVQTRRMTPLTLWLVNAKGKGLRIFVYVVPHSVLERPPNNDSRLSVFGEPWCHACNETFFWSPKVKPVPTYEAQNGKWCSKCRKSMPCR